jgi:hypothetical protein
VNVNMPPGVHWLTWTDFCQRFGWNSHRLRLLAGLELALDHLKAAGCHTVYVDGSFITDKDLPGDFDACWEMSGVDLVALQGTPLLTFGNGRAAQKAMYGGELFPATAQADSAGRRFLDFFQTDKETGGKKGIVSLNLKDLP